MKEREFRTFEIPCEVRASQRIIEAVIPYGIPADINGSFMETLKPGTFARSARERGDRIPVLFGHQHELPPVGKTDRLDESTSGLATFLRIAKTDRGDEVLSLAAEGMMPGISPAFQVPDGGDTWTDNGRTRVIREAKLIEISLTPWPAYPEAKVLAVRSTMTVDEAEALLNPATPALEVGRSITLALRELSLWS